MKNKTALADLGMIFITIIWGYGFIATKIAAAYMSANQMIFYRFFVSSVVMGIIFFKSLRLMDKRDALNSSILGFFLFMGFILQTEAINHTSIANNAFLTTLNVIIVPIIVAIFHKTKIDIYSAIGCTLAMIGTATLSFNMGFSLNLGDILSILCAFFFSLHIYFQSVYVTQTRTTILVPAQVMVATILAFLFTLFKGEMAIPHVPVDGVWGVLYLALLSTCLSFFVQAHCQKFTSAIKTVIIFSFEAVFASIFAVIIFGDIVTPRFLVGSSFIFAAVIISSTKLSFLKRSSVEDGNTD